jgi:hypothetical protein
MRARQVFGWVLLVTILGLSPLSAAAEFYTKFDKNDQRRGEAEAGHALVYVFRPATVGAAIKTWAFVDDDLMMVSKPKAYSFAQVPAGKRLFWTKSENTSALELEVEAGQTYYLQVKIKMGAMKARAKILQIDEATAEKFFAKCSYVEPSAEGLARAEEIAANRKHRAENKAGKQ